MSSTETTTGSIQGATGLQLEDRRDAGLRLAEKLRSRDLSAELVLALPRGGLPVGFEIAKGLGIPLDVFLVRKLGVPFQPELAFGAVAHGGARVLNSDILAQLDLEPDEIDAVAAVERVELERRDRAAFCGSSPLVQPPSKLPVSVRPPPVGSPRAASGGDDP